MLYLLKNRDGNITSTVALLLQWSLLWGFPYPHAVTVIFYCPHGKTTKFYHYCSKYCGYCSITKFPITVSLSDEYE